MVHSDTVHAAGVALTRDHKPNLKDEKARVLLAFCFEGRAVGSGSRPIVVCAAGFFAVLGIHQQRYLMKLVI